MPWLTVSSWPAGGAGGAWPAWRKGTKELVETQLQAILAKKLTDPIGFFRVTTEKTEWTAPRESKVTGECRVKGEVRYEWSCQKRSVQGQAVLNHWVAFLCSIYRAMQENGVQLETRGQRERR